MVMKGLKCFQGRHCSSGDIAMVLVVIFAVVFALFLVLSLSGGVWIDIKAMSFSARSKQDRFYRLITIHTYSPKSWFFGRSIRIPARGSSVAKRGVELARRYTLPIFLPVGAVTVPGTGKSEAKIYAEYLAKDNLTGVDILTSKNPAAKDTRSSLQEVAAVAKKDHFLPLLMVATRAHLPRIDRLLREMKDAGEFGEDDVDLVAVENSLRHSIWEFWMYAADIHLLRPGSRTRRLILNVMGRKT